MRSKVIMLGAGGTGGYIGLFMSKINKKFDIDIYDIDTVELKNISRQIYTFDDNGKEKSLALKEKIGFMFNGKITPYQQKIDEKTIFNTDGYNNVYIMISFDNMKARIDAIEALNKHKNTNIYVIDGGVDSFNGQIFYGYKNIKGKIEIFDKYNEFLYNSKTRNIEISERASCGISIDQTPNMNMLCACQMVTILRDLMYNPNMEFKEERLFIMNGVLGKYKEFRYKIPRVEL